jgi:hypothetical protein
VPVLAAASLMLNVEIAINVTSTAAKNL